MPQSRVTTRTKQPSDTLSTGVRPWTALMVVIYTQSVSGSASFTPGVCEPTVSNRGRYMVPSPTSVLFTTSIAPRLRQRSTVGHETRTGVSLGVFTPRAKFLKWFTRSLLCCMTFAVTLALVGPVTAGESAGFKRDELSLMRGTSPSVSRPILAPRFQTPAEGYLFYCRCSAFHVVAPTQTPSMHFVLTQLHLTNGGCVLYSIVTHGPQGGVSTFLCIVRRTKSPGIFHPITGIKIALFAHPISVAHFGFFGKSAMRSPRWSLGGGIASESGFRRSGPTRKAATPFPSLASASQCS